MRKTFIKRCVSKNKVFLIDLIKGTRRERGERWRGITLKNIMSEEDLSYTDRKKPRELSLQRRLDRVSIDHIKLVSSKLKKCDDDGGGC